MGVLSWTGAPLPVLVALASRFHVLLMASAMAGLASLPARFASLFRTEFMSRAFFMRTLACFPGLFRIEFMRSAFFMSRTTALSGDFPLLFFVHGAEATAAASVISMCCHDEEPLCCVEIPPVATALPCCLTKDFPNRQSNAVTFGGCRVLPR